MDKFPTFFKEDDEGGKLEIDEKQLEKIVSQILLEFNLELRRLESSSSSKDLTAIAVNKLGTETKSLVRARNYTIGLDMGDVEDLYEDMITAKATSAIFITSSHFTKDAKEFAKNVPVRLVDGMELGKFLTEHAVPKAEFAFLSAFGDDQVVRYFKRSKSEKLAGIIGTHETIEEVDKRYIPVGHFELKRVTRDTERTRNIYMDLSSGSIFRMEENRIEEDGFFKKILDLPDEAQSHLLDLIKYGELKHKHLDDKNLNILEKEKLVQVDEQVKGTGILDMVLDEITSTVSVATSEATSLSHPEPKDMELKTETKKFVKEVMSKPTIDTSHDLAYFIEASTETNPEFDPDPVHYEPLKVEKVLKSVYNKDDVFFKEMAYLPYYRCKYVSDYGAVRFKKLFTPKFKGFVPRWTPMTFVYRIIDVVPALPYILIGALYFLLNIGDIPKTLHVLSTAFIFVTVAVLVGLGLKGIFKTERRMPRYHGTIAKYGFPSIHALTAVGAIVFIYFVEPLLSLLMLPMGLLYIYSRLKLGVHSETDVMGGSVIGALLGLVFGLYVLNYVHLESTVEMVLASLFFIVPLIATAVETQYR